MQANLYLLGFIAGVVLTIQIGINSVLRHSLGSAPLAATVSFAVGLVGLIAFLLVTSSGLPSRATVAAVPAWAWTGGLLGAFYVATSVIVGPRLGSATLLALLVLGQLVASLVVDQFGWIGFPVHAVSAARLFGAALLFGGVLLITR